MGGPHHGPAAAGDRKAPRICAHENTLDFTHGRQDLLLSSGYFTPAKGEESEPSCASSLPWGWVISCALLSWSSHGARCCHGLLSVAVAKQSLLAFTALPAVSKMHFLICCAIILRLLSPPLLKTSKQVHLTMKAGTNVFLLVGNNEKSERLMCCCCLFSTALLVTNYNGWDLLSASLNKLIM